MMKPELDGPETAFNVYIVYLMYMAGLAILSTALHCTDVLDLHKLFASPAFDMRYYPKLNVMPNCFNLKLSNNASRF